MPKPVGFHPAFTRALEGVSPRIMLLDDTESTNDDARALARLGADHLTVVVADHQQGGRGRRGRRWVAAPGQALLASWVVRPDLPTERWSLLPLLAGVAVAEAIADRTGIAAGLKWPNDIVVDGAKLGGILVEAEPPSFAIVGVGVNVNQSRFGDGLAATSLALRGATRLDRADLLAAILRSFDAALGDVDGALERYRGLCTTLGASVRVQAEHGDVTGVASEVDARGALIVDGTTVTAGDVIHVR